MLFRSDGSVPGSSAGFGTMLLTAIVPGTLGGVAVREVRDGTLAYTLTVPLDTITERTPAANDPRLANRIIATSFGG